jgi:hypothetical protein
MRRELHGPRNAMAYGLHLAANGIEGFGRALKPDREMPPGGGVLLETGAGTGRTGRDGSGALPRGVRESLALLGRCRTLRGTAHVVLFWDRENDGGRRVLPRRVSVDQGRAFDEISDNPKNVRLRFAADAVKDGHRRRASTPAVHYRQEKP